MKKIVTVLVLMLSLAVSAQSADVIFECFAKDAPSDSLIEKFKLSIDENQGYVFSVYASGLWEDVFKTTDYKVFQDSEMESYVEYYWKKRVIVTNRPEKSGSAIVGIVKIFINENSSAAIMDGEFLFMGTTYSRLTSCKGTHH